MKKRFLALLLCAALLLPTLALAQVQPLPIDQSGGYPVSTDNLIGEEEYQDESIHVTTQRMTYKRAKCMYVHITIKDPSQLRTAMTRDDYETKEYVKTKLLAKKKNSVLAVNGDFFKYNDYGYLVRQGVLYRDRADMDHDVLLIDENADFHIVMKPTDESVHAAVAELEAAGHKVINSFNFGPTLVVDGQVQEVNQSLYQGRYKMMRLAIGQLGPLEYGIYFCFGTSDAQSGLTMANFASFIAETTPNVKLAYNLDGGGSAHVVLLQKQLHKNPSGRDICDLIYFASASDLLGSERAE
mgnify:CR=1 FL=1